MPDDLARTVGAGSLIAADKLVDTPVFNTAGEKLGTIEHLMLDKISGQTIYAVMSFGGFLGIGEAYHPLPWSALKYDERAGGYVVDLDRKLLEAAPWFERIEDFRWTPEYGRTVDRYYRAPPYWT
jgi:hypothetical protein